MSDQRSIYSILSMGIVCSSVLLSPVAALASLLIPSDLAAGQGYRLAFVTYGAIQGTSADISTYNSFVVAIAAQNRDLAGLAWSAIVSTSSVNAVDNVACVGCNDVPIYLLDTTRIAASTTALFSTGLLQNFDRDQFGDVYFSVAWTGSNSSGTSSTNPLGTSRPEFGASDFSDNRWITLYSEPSDYVKSVYALSSELFVADTSSVPEPSSLALLGAGVLAALGLRARGQRATS